MATTQTVMIDPTLFRTFLQRFAAALCRVRPRHTGTAGGYFIRPPAARYLALRGSIREPLPFLSPTRQSGRSPSGRTIPKIPVQTSFPRPFRGGGEGVGAEGGAAYFTRRHGPL